MRQSIATTIVAAALILATTGCATFPQGDPTIQAAEAEFDLPPRQLLERVKEVVTSPPLSLGIEEEARGSLLTTPQRFPGRWNVGRRWQEQTRYRITVIPDFDQPAQRARVQVREFTEQRAAEGMRWEATDTLPRPERAAEVLEQIRQRAGNL